MGNGFQKIGILGTGTIGSSWASFYASKGIKIKLFDSDQKNFHEGQKKITQNLDSLAGFGLVTEKAVEEAKDNIRPVGSIAELVEDADFIQESALEDYDVKKKVFAEMDRITASSVVIASSSSGLLITEIQKVMKHPQRSLIAHPFNPPHLIPLVELVQGEQTSPEIIKTVYDFYEGLGKIPVALKKEVPGHIANRLAAALWREAIDLVASGVASVEDVDKALYAGPGIRWAIMGQHLIYQLGGGSGGYEYFINHIGKSFEKYWKGMASWTEIPEDAKKMVIEGLNDSIQGKSMTELAEWRDEKLVKMLKAIYG